MNLIPHLLAFVFLFTGAILHAQTSLPDCLDESCLEVLHFDSVRVNGHVPLRLKDEELLLLLGKPDSIKQDEGWECGNFIDSEETVRILFYGKTQFMSSNGTSLLYVFDFSGSRFTFDFNGKQLKSGTTQADLRQLFPNSLSALEQQIQGYNQSGIMKVLMKETPDFGESSGWLFTFEGELLKEIKLWWFIC